MLGEQQVHWNAFLPTGRGEGRLAADGPGYGFRIEFAQAIQGPVAGGWGAHFGMGEFEADGPK